MSKATWNTHPTSDEWNAADNWTPAGHPGDTAVFSASSQTSIGFSADSDAKIESIQFTDQAPGYTFHFGPGTTPALTITGEGVSNASRKQQSFIVAATSSGHEDPQLVFSNTASAGGDDVYYCAGPITQQGYGGGVISFRDQATAGSASFKVWTGAARPPKDKKSTVGGEISFSDTSSAGSARFTLYGTLGSDYDTFGNVVFHDTASASRASFTNVGGTVSGGDGGNTQFYGTATADHAVFNNWGGTQNGANGGDVAFDSTSNAGQGFFYNHAAVVEGAYGGVTSFNNNPLSMAADQGASAGHGAYFNYGAREGEQGGGGHLSFSARYGSPTAADAQIVNYGSAIADTSSAGHTIFSITLSSDKHDNSGYFPSAGSATIWNHPASKAGAAAGYTEFAVFVDKYDPPSKKQRDDSKRPYPTAANATILNLGGYTPEAKGGQTIFADRTSADGATLIAYGGTRGGQGGKIIFCDMACGGTATIKLFDNGELDISKHSGGLTIGAIELTGGIITTQLGSEATPLTVSGDLFLNATHSTFSFSKKADGGFALNTAYTLLTSSHLSSYTAERFRGNSLDGVTPTFAIVGNNLQVTFKK